MPRTQNRPPLPLGDVSLQGDDALIALQTTGAVQLVHEDILGTRKDRCNSRMFRAIDFYTGRIQAKAACPVLFSDKERPLLSAVLSDGLK
jgi:hypothetical protein